MEDKMLHNGPDGKGERIPKTICTKRRKKSTTAENGNEATGEGGDDGTTIAIPYTGESLEILQIFYNKS